MGVNTAWEYGGLAFELDMFKASTADKYNEAFNKLEERAKSVPTEGSLGDIIRAQCKVYLELFDEILGDGAALQITNGETDNLRVCMDAAASLVAFVNEQGREAGQAQKAFFRKYAPRARG